MRFTSSLVVELDLPWDDRQVDTFGASFKAWTDVEFETAIVSIKDACPFSQLTYVVIRSAWLTCLGVP